MQLTQEHLKQFLASIEAQDERYQKFLDSVPLNFRPILRITSAGFEDVKKASNKLSLKYNSEQCTVIYKFYKNLIRDMCAGVSFNGQRGNFNVKKAVVLLGFTCTVTTPATVRILTRLLENNDVVVDPTVRALIPIVELLANLLYRRDKIPEVQRTLEEIQDSSVNFILNYLATGNKTIINFSEDILVMMVARKLYNAMYWYMYGKQ